MGNAPNVVAAAGVPFDSAIATRVLEAFRAQIGADRFAVWFGDAASVTVVVNPGAGGSSSAPCVVLTIGTGFTHEWLRRTFRVEFEAAARDICGGFVEVAWEPQPEGARPPESPPTPAEPPRQLCVVARPPQSPATPVRRQPPRLAEFVDHEHVGRAAGPAETRQATAVQGLQEGGRELLGRQADGVAARVQFAGPLAGGLQEVRLADATGAVDHQG